jgi:hypothetical protein
LLRHCYCVDVYRLAAIAGAPFRMVHSMLHAIASHSMKHG